MGGVALIWSSIGFGFGFFTLPVRYSSLSAGVFYLAFFSLTLQYHFLNRSQATHGRFPTTAAKESQPAKKCNKLYYIIIFDYLRSEQEANQFMIPGTNWDLKSKAQTVSSSKENEKTAVQDSKEKDKFT